MVAVRVSTSPSKGPATTAPLEISMAMATPPSTGRHDPTESPQGNGAVPSFRVLHLVERAERQLQHPPDVVVGPRRRLGTLEVDSGLDDVFLALEQDLHVERHSWILASCSSSRAGSVTGSRQVKFVQTYAVGHPLISRRAPTKGSRSARRACPSPGVTRSRTANGR